jgi:AMMECR1 domain-containing protein
MSRPGAWVAAVIALTFAGALAFTPAPAFAAAPALAAGQLEPYRALARSPRGAQLLVYARQQIASALDAEHAAPADTSLPDWPGAPCGVYLTLSRGASTRACVGSLLPLGSTLSATLRELSRQIVASDPRHVPLRRGEPDSLRLVIAFAGTPVAIADPMQVSPARDGLLIVTPNGSVAFLPGEARTVSWALREARRIGLLSRASDAAYQAFPVVTLQEPLVR